MTKIHFQKYILQLTKSFNERKIITDVMYIVLDSDVRLKFRTGVDANGGTDRIKVTAFDKNIGVIDEITLRFKGIETEMEQLQTQLTAYAELFCEQEQAQGMSMTQQM